MDDEPLEAVNEPTSDDIRRARLNERVRSEFIAGAEEESMRRFGRALTRDELERVLGRYPGD